MTRRGMLETAPRPSPTRSSRTFSRSHLAVAAVQLVGSGAFWILLLAEDPIFATWPDWLVIVGPPLLFAAAFGVGLRIRVHDGSIPRVILSRLAGVVVVLSLVYTSLFALLMIFMNVMMKDF